jgi:YidC/Oxa1 family membrane protein insertase
MQSNQLDVVRTILAFVFIFLIILFFYGRRQRQTVPPAPADTHRVAVEPPPSVPPTSEPPPQIQPKIVPEEDLEERRIVVDGDLFRVELSSLGAAVTSYSLKKYRVETPDSTSRARRGHRTEWVQLIPPGERALTITLSDDSGSLDTEPLLWAVDEEDTLRLSAGMPELTVDFVLEMISGEKVLKRFSFRNNDYRLGLEVSVSGMQPFKQSVIWGSGLMVTEKASKDDLHYFGSVALLGGVELRRDPLAGGFRRSGLSKEPVEYSGDVDWAGVRTKYFLACIIPDGVETEGVVARSVEEREVQVVLQSVPVTHGTYEVYVGPIHYAQLRELGNGLERVVDFGKLAPIAKLILAVLTSLHRVIPNYGVVIMVFSAIMMGVFFPLSYRSMHQMRRMQALQGRVEELRKKYSKDAQRMNKEMMELYRKEGVNPLGGCLPLLFQMPVFFALYAILRSTIELRGASFLWISDLSQGDPYFVLPLLMGGAMFIQQRITVTDPRQKMMTFMMPIFLTFIFLRLPAAIVLYWFVYNVLSIGQQYLIHRRLKETPVVTE